MEKKMQAKVDQKKFAKLFEQAAGEEIASLRSANIKQYDLGLGRRQAVLYPEAVHYQAENGEWTEIDNTLVMETDVYGRAAENAAGRIRGFRRAGAAGEQGPRADVVV